MHGQYVEMFSFQAHSRGEVVRHVALLDRAHTGTLAVQFKLLLQATPPQCSVPTAGGAAAWHCVSDRKRAADRLTMTIESERDRFLKFGMRNLRVRRHFPDAPKADRRLNQIRR